MLKLQSDFSRFRKARSGELHFAAHSHHFWPDVSFEGQSTYWELAATHYDDKWGKIFSETLAHSASEIAHELRLSSPSTLAFGANTHELFFRLISSFDLGKKKISVLTTDSEFHSAFRQLNRLVEGGYVEVQVVNAEPFSSFQARFEKAATEKTFDLIFFSQVFFDSGFSLDLKDLGWASDARKRGSMVVIDGYHGFMALPTDLSKLEDHIFYLGGGYKYAMAGEGACFLHIPKKAQLRPIFTGWFSEMDHLATARPPLGEKQTAYATGGAGFLGATFDASAWSRFLAVQNWKKTKGLTTGLIHSHVLELQTTFLQGISRNPNPYFLESERIAFEPKNTGSHFLTFRTSRAGEHVQSLRKKGIWTDSRMDRLRVGFGIYQSTDDVLELLKRIQT
ncbi:MAG: aminotransferase class V-fold PLP-dependent enzyme [Bdellovibrionales bacterium]|nr:aminotransferase class V-fold PLP-dependent enzyme [Bdellovibrionales bacterium]